MNPLAFFPLTLCVILETLEQISYNMAGRRSQLRILCIVLGIGLHIVLLGVWFWVLKLLPLGIAMPCLGANYATVALASRFFFKEKIDRWRWLGISIIVLGLVVIGGVNL